jgi:Domain of unknown function (DUF4333)
VNRPPPPTGPEREPGPDTPWYLRRPNSDDHTRIARPRPTPQPGHPAPAPPPARRLPPVGHRPRDIPWYLQPPDRSKPPPPAVEHPTSPTELKSTDTAGGKSLPWWLLVSAGAVAALIAVAVLLTNLSNPGITGGTVLDVNQVQKGVLQTLSDPAGGYGANAVTDVSCNGGRNPSAHRGTTFTCDATINGASRQVAVVVSDDKGTYEIDRPR